MRKRRTASLSASWFHSQSAIPYLLQCDPQFPLAASKTTLKELKPLEKLDFQWIHSLLDGWQMVESISTALLIALFCAVGPFEIMRVVNTTGVDLSNRHRPHIAAAIVEMRKSIGRRLSFRSFASRS